MRSIRTWMREVWAVGTKDVVSARIISTWRAGKPLSPPDDYRAFAEDGYRRNSLIASCIWEIVTSAAEPRFIVKKKQSDGMHVVVTDSRDPLVALLAKPNEEHTTYTLLEQLFTHQQISGNWFLRKLRSQAGNVVALWPLRPDKVRIIPNKEGWVESYRFLSEGAVGEGLLIPANDVVHDPLHPDPLNDFWGLSPIAVLSRFGDLDNSATDYLRAFFQNDATPAGILKLKAKVPPEERQTIKEKWIKEHTQGAGWHTVSVLDADAEYVSLGASPDKLRMQSLWDQTETRICASFGVPPILVGALVGLNRSTFANYAEARKSFWEETLSPLYSRCAQRLTEGLAHEFGDDYVIEFDLTTILALQENQNAKRQYAFDGWNNGLLTMNQALTILGLPLVVGDAGEERKSVAPINQGFGGLLRRSSMEHHARSLTTNEKRAMARFRRVARQHFQAQGKALVTHLKD